jgi:hypothetical protein
MSTEGKKFPLAGVAAVVALLLATFLIIWQIRAQSRPQDLTGKEVIPAGPLANSTPVPEEIKMLEAIRKNPELVKQHTAAPK